MKIRSLKAREILNSRAEATLEVELGTEQGIFFASVPFGISKGKYEAKQLKTEKAIKNINEIIGPTVSGDDFSGLKKFDEALFKLDGSKNKSNLGANAILPVSMAFARALAVSFELPLYSYLNQVHSGQPFVKKAGPLTLPRPAVLMIEGAKHGGNDLDVQEFLFLPEKETFKESIWTARLVFESLEEILEQEFGKTATNLGEEGGFAPPLRKTKQALDLIMKASAKARVKAGVALDMAASHFYKKGNYNFESKQRNIKQMLVFYQRLTRNYPILFLEDPFSQDDWEGWQAIMSKVKSQKSKLLIVGDDLTVTNPEKIKMAEEEKACKAIIIKPNQIGTVTETVEAVKLAQEYGWKIIVSHRSGETNDDFIADLAVAVRADFIKAGALARGERVAKYNRLLKIEEELKIN